MAPLLQVPATTYHYRLMTNIGFHLKVKLLENLTNQCRTSGTLLTSVEPVEPY